MKSVFPISYCGKWHIRNYTSPMFIGRRSRKKTYSRRSRLSKTENADTVSSVVTCDECNGWLNPALAVDAAVQRGDEILLIQRKFPPMVGYWGLPGGFVERDEDPLDAVLRELEEETGLVGANPELLMVMGDPNRDPRKHIVSVVYLVGVESGEPVAGDDAADARFWPLQDVLNGEVPLAGDHMQIIKNWFNLSDS